MWYIYILVAAVALTLGAWIEYLFMVKGLYAGTLKLVDPIELRIEKAEPFNRNTPYILLRVIDNSYNADN